MGVELKQKLADAQSTEGGRRPGEIQVLWVLWLTYGAFYFCRVNLGVAVAQPTFKEELQLTKDDIGWIGGTLLVAYGVGQLINGQLAEQFSARRLLAIGMLCSALFNLLFAFTTGYIGLTFSLTAGLALLVFFWGANGYSQALGWTPIVRVVANWFPPERRGRAMGFLGTGYQLTTALTFLVCTGAARLMGWRGAFYVPAGLLAGTAIIMYLFLRESPDDHRAPREKPTNLPINTDRTGSAASSNVANSLGTNILLTLTNPALWLLALMLGLLNACRWSYLYWGLTHLLDVQKRNAETGGIWESAIQYAILPLGGITGAYLTGWVTDRFLGGRRAPAICAMMILLGLLTLAYDWMAHVSFAGTVLLLLFIGFAIYGPQVLLVGAAPADLAKRGTAAAAVGFVEFTGYLGAGAGVKITGFVVERYDWHVALFVVAGWAFAGALTAVLLWNATAHRSHRTRTEHQAAGNVGEH